MGNPFLNGGNMMGNQPILKIQWVSVREHLQETIFPVKSRRFPYTLT